MSLAFLEIHCVLAEIIGSSHYLQFMKSNAELAQRFQLDILEHLPITQS